MADISHAAHRSFIDGLRSSGMLWHQDGCRDGSSARISGGRGIMGGIGRLDKDQNRDCRHGRV
jgi:hypothetical protein